MKILVINSGSSSIKYRLFDMTDKTELASGLLEQIGEMESRLTHQKRNSQGGVEEMVKTEAVANHQKGFKLIGSVLGESGAIQDTGELFGIGHRVVNGGEQFQKPTLINQEVIETVRKLIPLAPLHNPSNLLGIEVAIKKGESIETSMGMTPLEGLIMGTRSGDIDPVIIFYLGRQTGLGSDDVETILHNNSGLKGICDKNDMREIEVLAQAGNPLPQLAIKMYCYRIKKYIGAYYAVLGRLDALVFTGGIGENSTINRAGSCQGLSHMEIEVDPDKKAKRSKTAFEIQTDDSPVNILVVPTKEELEIAEQTLERIQSTSGNDIRGLSA